MKMPKTFLSHLSHEPRASMRGSIPPVTPRLFPCSGKKERKYARGKTQPFQRNPGPDEKQNGGDRERGWARIYAVGSLETDFTELRHGDTRAKYPCLNSSDPTLPEV